MRKSSSRRKKLLETYYQFDFHFGPGGMLLCALLIILLVANAISGARGPSFSRMASSLMLLGGVLFYLAYNYLEATSLGYAGYTRYYLFPFALLCAGLLFLQWPWKLQSSSAMAVVATFAAIVLNGGVLSKYYTNLHKNDAARNFTETLRRTRVPADQGTGGRGRRRRGAYGGRSHHDQ